MEFALAVSERAKSVHRVLNAFRHHWNSHLAIAEPDIILLECSTPFGIIGIRTTAAMTTATVDISAQRLSASLEFAPEHWQRFVPNAFLSAQRLSASLEFARSMPT